MKFIRYKVDKTEYRGILDGDKIKRINGTIFHDYSLTTDVVMLSDVTILPPVLPSKIIGFRKNYNGKREDISPKIFLKPPTTVIASNDDIIIPAEVDDVRIEGEMAVVIGKKCKNIPENHVLHHILGYIIANDITASQNSPDLNVTIGKFYDSFTPLGPFINTELDISNLEITTYKNNEICQHGFTSSMVYDVLFQVSYLSHIMTLNPGDVILTGTPADAVNVENGDVVTINIENLGTLENKCVKENNG